MSTAVKPRPARPVDEGVAPRLRADVKQPAKERYLVGYEIELVSRAPEHSDAWTEPLWRHIGDPWSDHPEVDELPEQITPGERVRRPWVARIGSRPAKRNAQMRRLSDRMTISETRPTFLVFSIEPASLLEWRLRDDERDLDDSKVTHSSVVSADGHWFRFHPKKALRRTDELREERPGRNEFFEPFEPPRGTSKPREYIGFTYAGHTPHAIDFNRGTGTTDLGDPVYASASGTVEWVLPENGEVHVVHRDGWQTRYAHMDPILVGQGDPVEPWTILGKISRKYFKEDEEGPISPHLHYQQMKAGAVVPARFKGDAYKYNKPVAGWRRPIGTSQADLDIRVVRAADGKPSVWWPMRLRVAKKGDKPGRDRPEIDVEYDGERLATGEYSVRYRSVDDLGEPSQWAYDHTLVVRLVAPGG